MLLSGKKSREEKRRLRSRLFATSLLSPAGKHQTVSQNWQHIIPFIFHLDECSFSTGLPEFHSGPLSIYHRAEKVILQSKSNKIHCSKLYKFPKAHRIKSTLPYFELEGLHDLACLPLQVCVCVTSCICCYPTTLSFFPPYNLCIYHSVFSEYLTLKSLLLMLT